MKLKVLKANSGDCLLLSWEYNNKKINILIDGGTTDTYKKGWILGDLFHTLKSIDKNNENIDLLIVTHVDSDHIGGVLNAFKGDGLLGKLCKKVWFNSGKLIHEYFNQQHDESHEIELEKIRTGKEDDDFTSITQGVTFEKIIQHLNIWERQLILAGQEYNFNGAKINILSPTTTKIAALLKKWKKENPDSLTAKGKDDYGQSLLQLIENDSFKEDAAPHNGSSIAILFELNDKKILFLGDAHNQTIVDSIRSMKDSQEEKYSEDNKLNLDYVKISHHGSSHNTSNELLEIINTNNFIISTNGCTHNLPNKRTLARIHHKFPTSTIWFNYASLIDKIFTPNERRELRERGLSLCAIEDEFEL